MGFFTNSLVKNITIGENVTFKNNFMYNAFYNCTNFNSPVTIPNSAINTSRMFYNCRNFNSPVTLPNSIVDMSYMFYYCQNFRQPVTIPNSVTNMYMAFYQVTNLNYKNVNITIPAGVNNLAYAFYGCNIGGNIYIRENNVQNMYYMFAGRNNGWSPRLNIFIDNKSATFNGVMNQNNIRYFIGGSSYLNWTSSGLYRFNQSVNVFIYQYQRF